MHKGLSADIFEELTRKHPTIKHGRNFSRFMRQMWRELPYAARKKALVYAEDFGGSSFVREPLGFIPDGFIAGKESNGRVRVEMVEVEVTSFLTTRKAHKAMALSEVLSEAGVHLVFRMVDRYGVESIQDPERVWLWHPERARA